MRRRITAAALALLSLVLTASAAARPGNGGRGGITYAIVGDTPYGAVQLADFPRLVAAVNADPDVELTVHLGDIKDGASLCTDAYFDQMRANFDTFQDPFVLTPGDNEWTDCHRPAAGGFLPTERLARLRTVFYPRAHQSLGIRRKSLETQADSPGFGAFVENRLWKAQKVVFATVHVTGSNNDLVPWFGTAETPAQTAARLAEYQARLAATLAWLDRAFAFAQEEDARGVVIAMQANMWFTTALGFTEIVQRLADRAAAFGRPVLLLEGDSHRFTVDRPLVAGSVLHGVTTAAPNLTRVIVEGETIGEWLRLRIDPNADQLFTWARMPVL
jgi:Calcineurin-like phosphoesterase